MNEELIIDILTLMGAGGWILLMAWPIADSLIPRGRSVKRFILGGLGILMMAMSAIGMAMYLMLQGMIYAFNESWSPLAVIVGLPCGLALGLIPCLIMAGGMELFVNRRFNLKN